MSNNVLTAKDISEKLNEPEFLFLAREKALNEASSTGTYGLGISAKEAGQTFPIVENPARYQFENQNNLRVLTFAEAMKDETIVTELKNNLKIGNSNDGKLAESFASFGGGIVIVAKKECDVSFEFQSELITDGSDIIVIIAENNSTLRVFEEVKSEQPLFFGRNIFAVVKENATLVFAGSVEIPAGSSYFSHKHSQVASEGKIEWYDLHSGAEMVRSLTEDSLDGPGAVSFVNTLLLCSEEHFDMHNVVRHNADHTSSHIFARGIAGGGGKVIYRALSDIRPGILNAQSRQDGRFLITNSGAEVDAIPSLDIAGSESNSSHALSISYLTEKDFFYPALRGIAPYRAQAMLLSGFLSKPLEKLPDEWQTKFIEKINKKLSSPLFRVGE